LLEKLSVCLLVTNGLGRIFRMILHALFFLFHRPVKGIFKITTHNSCTTVQYRINGNKAKFEAVSKGQQQKVAE
jgi:hypothetical protein